MNRINVSDLNVEKKECPRCQQEFFCNVSNIEQCQCSKINLSKLHSRYISEHYTGCVCFSCLKLMVLEFDKQISD